MKTVDRCKITHEFINSFPIEYEMNIAHSLLNTNINETLPKNIELIINFCVKQGIGFILSRNIKSLSCSDARNNRMRLGYKGIPLYDEFKSIIFVGFDNEGNEKIIAAHCRGHMSLNTNNIRDVFQLVETPQVLPETELEKRYGMVLGTVNPILVELNSFNKIINIFDKGLLEPMTKCPGTMMTNAGDHTWGIEFDPAQLIRKMKNKIIASIAYPDKELKLYEIPSCINPRSIGIITGNGAESGIALWQGINKHFVKYLDNHFLGDISLPKVFIISLPSMGLSMELDKRDSSTRETILEAVNRLKEQDIDLLTLACHTTHYYTKEIRKLFETNGKMFISMAETTMGYLFEQKIDDIALLGINFVADFDKYSAYKDLKHLKVENISNDALMIFHKLGYDIKRMARMQGTLQQFINLLKTIHSNNVVLALTELSILYEKIRKKHHSGKNIIDPLDIYAETIAKKSLGLL